MTKVEPTQRSKGYHSVTPNLVVSDTKALQAVRQIADRLVLTFIP